MVAARVGFDGGPDSVLPAGDADVLSGSGAGGQDFLAFQLVGGPQDVRGMQETAGRSAERERDDPVAGAAAQGKPVCEQSGVAASGKVLGGAKAVLAPSGRVKLGTSNIERPTRNRGTGQVAASGHLRKSGSRGHAGRARNPAPCPGRGTLSRGHRAGA